MDIERLTKSQIVLLTLLVSFVTSIATGIVTVSLMDQAPPIVAQTVNRVIERTVETVAAAPAAGQTAAPTVITQEKTVVIKESDQIVQAVERSSPSLVRVFSSSEADALFLGLGLVIDSGGTIITDAAAIDQRSEAVIALSDSSRVRMLVSRRDKDTGLVFLTPATSSAAKMPSWVAAKISSDKPVLGASIVALSGKTIARIASGLVTAVIQSDGGAIIDTNIPESSIMHGSPIIDTSGTILGVSTAVSRASSPTGFITASVLLAQ